MTQLPLDITTFDSRVDALVEAAIERVASAAHAEIHAMAVFARRSTGQTTRYAKERLKKLAHAHP